MFRSCVFLRSRQHQHQLLFCATSILRCAHSSSAAADVQATSSTPWGSSSTSASSAFENATFDEAKLQPASSTSSSLIPDVESVLEVVRQDAGETAKYYADKYFDGSEVKVSSILWNNLKKFGHVDIDRSVMSSAVGGSSDDASANAFYDLGGEGNSSGASSSMTNEPRWFPAARFPRKGPRVSRYRAEDNDLSLLKAEETAQAEKISSILDDENNAKNDSEEGNNNNIETAGKGFPDSPWSNLKRGSSFGATLVSEVEPPASAGWGGFSNASTPRGAASSGSRKTVTTSSEARWKRDISKLQRSALSAPKAPKNPWN